MNIIPLFEGFDSPEENWSKLPHALIASLPQITSLAEMKVILYVLRHTWGYREYDEAKTITGDEFANGRKKRDGSRIDDGIGMSEPSIRNGIKNAIEHGFLTVEIDDRDKARIEKSYKLVMKSTDEGVNSLPSGGKKFTPNTKTINPRSEKETKEKKPKNSDADKPRRLNPVFEAVANQSFGIVDTSKLDKQSGARIGKITAWVQKHGATVEKVDKFYAWYPKETGGAANPKDVDKFAEWFVKYEASLERATQNVIEFDISDWEVPELETA